jgi:hypothetical protein
MDSIFNNLSSAHCEAVMHKRMVVAILVIAVRELYGCATVQPVDLPDESASVRSPSKKKRVVKREHSKV